LQYGHYYGTPTANLVEALNINRCFLFAQVEVGGWERVSRFAQKYSNIPIISTFILPNRKYEDYKEFLLDQRKNEFNKRLSKAGWELERAADLSDIIIINPTTSRKSLQGVAASNSLISFLTEILPEETEKVNFS